MVNYDDPRTIARDSTALINFHHFLTGVYIWEFFTTLDFEWDVIRGRRPYRRSIWIYSIARVTTLWALGIEWTSFDNPRQINCPVWGKFAIALPNTAFASASLLIVLRIVAIWNRERIVILIAIGVWLTDVAFLLVGAIRVSTVWSSEGKACILVNPENIKPNIMGSLIADVVLLTIMLIGLLPPRFGGGDAIGLDRVLWKQGIVWLLAAIIVEIPPTVFICLDLNEPMNFMFQPLNVITITVAATRMYRSLMDMGSSEAVQQSVRDSGRTISKAQVRSEPIPLSRMEPVRTEMDQSSKPQGAGSNSHTSTDLHGRYKTHEASHTVDVTTVPEK